MKMKTLMAIGVTTAMLLGVGSVSAATIQYNNLTDSWGSKTSGNSANGTFTNYLALPSSQGGQEVAQSGQYSTNSQNTNTSGIGKPTHYTTSFTDTWSIKSLVSGISTVNFGVSFDSENMKFNANGAANNSDANGLTLVDASNGNSSMGLASLISDPVTGYDVYSFGNLLLDSTHTYRLTLKGGLTNIGKSHFSNEYTYSLTSPALAAPLPTPIPGAVWLFGTGIAGLLGFKRRGSVATVGVLKA
jgi:hypothetical protein